MEIELTTLDKQLIDKYGFTVSMAGDRFVVRDDKNKKLGKNGRLEGGSLSSLLIQAEEARKATTPEGFVASRKAKPGRVAAKPKQAAPRAPSAPAVRVAKAAIPRLRKQRDMSAMNAVYEAVINGMEPLVVYDTLTARGIHLMSDRSTYTHSAIAKRVMERARHLGWKPPKAEKE